MPKYRTPSLDIIMELQTQIKALNRRIEQLENAKTTTTPIYAKNSLGNRDLVLGQVFVGLDNTLNYVSGAVDQTTVYEIHGTIFTF